MMRVDREDYEPEPALVPIYVAWRPDDGLWKLTIPYVRRTTVEPSRYGYASEQDDPTLIQVPIDFLTDFATVPRLLWPLLPPIGRYAGAALIHDFLYAKSIKGRSWADAVFLDLMKQDGVGWLTRHVLWASVRVFGRGFWA